MTAVGHRVSCGGFDTFRFIHQESHAHGHTEATLIGMMLKAGLLKKFRVFMSSQACLWWVLR